MEKKQKNLVLKKGSRKLPTISQNRSLNHLQSKMPELLTSPSHLNDLRKLFYQYKSNANILTNSPYYTNRQHNHQIITFMHANKHKPSSQQLSVISEKFELNSELEQKIKGLSYIQYDVRLRILNVSLNLTLKARNVQELELLLKKQFAIQQVKSHGNSKKVQSIGGFQSTKLNYHLDYLLSIKNNVLRPGKYDLKPWFFEEVKTPIGLKDFRLIRCLGTGGFSLVYLARDKWKGDFYALKLIDKTFILESERQTIVQNQRFVLGELKSPFVTALKFSFQTKNHFVFAIQYCPGGQLFYQLKKVKRMNEDQAKFYFLEILIGLDYIHKKGIIYRDLKPENLLLAADGHVKLADFGLAKPLMGRQTAQSFCGSPQYMAPEMLLKTGHKSTLDYYCLGTLLYELVFGLPPYYSLNHNQIYDGILNEDLSFPSSVVISPQLKNMLYGLLQKNPNKRLGCLYGVKQILFHPWIGRIKKNDIEEKKLIPPFIPDLTNFNFDQTQLTQRIKEMQPKLEQDITCTRFQNHFNHEFYYADPNSLPQVVNKQKSIKQFISKSKEKKKNSLSLTRRVASERGKSK